MIWLVLLVVAVVAGPFVIEAMRAKMDRGARARAPGHIAQLPSGLTHYDWIGPARGPVMVCVHGLTTPSFVWRALAPLMAEMGFRVLIYDLYGRGFSDRPRARQDTDFFLTQLEELLDDQGVTEPASFMGYSMGGAIVAAFARRRPGQVQRLVLLAPAGMHVIRDGLARFARDVPVLGDWAMQALWPGMHRRAILSDPAEPEVENFTARLEEELGYQGYARSVLSSIRGALAEPMEAEHRAIHEAGIPVLAVWGRDDTVIELRSMGELTLWNRAARHEVVDGAGHGLPYTHSGAVAEAFRTALLDGL